MLYRLGNVITVIYDPYLKRENLIHVEIVFKYNVINSLDFIVI